MGFSSNSKEKAAEIRGVPDEVLPRLSNEELIMLALARLYQSEGVGDEALIEELYRRGRKSG